MHRCHGRVDAGARMVVQRRLAADELRSGRTPGRVSPVRAKLGHGHRARSIGVEPMNDDTITYGRAPTAADHEAGPPRPRAELAERLTRA
jgi:hypothetical protein